MGFLCCCFEMDCSYSQGKLPPVSPFATKKSQCNATMQPKNLFFFFFCIYKVEPSGEWLMQPLQESQSLNLSALKLNALGTRNSMPFSTLPGKTSGCRIIECESWRVGVSRAWVFLEVPVIMSEPGSS